MSMKNFVEAKLCKLKAELQREIKKCCDDIDTKIDSVTVGEKGAQGERGPAGPAGPLGALQ